MNSIALYAVFVRENTSKDNENSSPDIDNSKHGWLPHTVFVQRCIDVTHQVIETRPDAKGKNALYAPAFYSLHVDTADRIPTVAKKQTYSTFLLEQWQRSS